MQKITGWVVSRDFANANNNDIITTTNSLLEGAAEPASKFSHNAFMMRRATNVEEDPSRPLAQAECEDEDEDEEEWIYLYDEPLAEAAAIPAPPNREDPTSLPTATITTSKIPLTSWLSHLPSTSLLSTLSIPGTHNSCARIPPVPFVACQSATLTQQLHLGIRYFDFRLGIFKTAFGSGSGILRLYHGKTPLGITFAEALREIYGFLEREKGECVVLQIKHEGVDGDEGRFEELVRGEVEGNEGFWAVGTGIPRLGEVRGRIQLMRRFRIQGDGGLGINVLRWADNAKRFWIPVSPPGCGGLMVQDEYKFTDRVSSFEELIRRKVGVVKDLMIEARLVDTEVRRWGWYLNWCNAFAEPFSGLKVVATPEQIALGRGGEYGVNEMVREMIGEARSRGERVRVGTILLDFVDVRDPRIVQEVVLCNKFPEQ